MLAFEIHVNGKRICTAGIGEPGVLSAILNWVRSERHKNEKNDDDFASIRVGALIGSTEEHVTWMQRDLRPGDEVLIRVVETERADEPQQRDREAAAKIRSRQEEQVRMLVKKFGWKLETQ